MEENRTERITFLVTPTEREIIEQLAKDMQRTMSDAVRIATLTYAENGKKLQIIEN